MPGGKVASRIGESRALRDLPARKERSFRPDVTGAQGGAANEVHKVLDCRSGGSAFVVDPRFSTKLDRIEAWSGPTSVQADYEGCEMSGLQERAPRTDRHR